MEKDKKKFRDRRDATRLEMSGLDKILYGFKPHRCQAEVYILKSLDVTELVKYYEKEKKKNKDFTYFHIFSASIGKVIYNRPQLNNFIIGGKKYKKDDVSLSFVAKTDFSDNSTEYLSVINVEEDDTLKEISDKIKGSVKRVRHNSASSTDNFINNLKYLPSWLVRFIIWCAQKLDNHDILPKSLMEGDVYHSSVLISNLGSVHCGGIYHNLANYGTNSILCTIGEIRDDVRVVDGKKEVRKVCDFGVTLDERIADGVYMVRSVNLLQYIFDNPKLLEDKANDKVTIRQSK